MLSGKITDLSSNWYSALQNECGTGKSLHFNFHPQIQFYDTPGHALMSNPFMEDGNYNIMMICATTDTGIRIKKVYLRNLKSFSFYH
jgi:hypothetical protein